MSEDLKRKLSSRKLWLAVGGFVASVLVLFGTDASEIEKVTAMITALGSVVTYVLAEGYVDGKRENAEKSE
ncbi:hypothetical protein KM924_23015 [Brevibacillus parabrevis]|uniref:hypothetical protein n=1 Tax=Brevibacillus parabrevis TaxID=54914 RepID=UPI001C221D96|nr:hypothetical protein [Brevibacillus parabrevis]MBU8715376.1 hypothetical protein [Brevibacillus parabrevis]